MRIRYFHIALMVWISSSVPSGLAEDFPNRPTEYEMEGLVVSGTQCARGVNERCWATQYSINPVQYRVTPFTNTAGFYLDQNLMGTMASKIRSLVSYYINYNNSLVNSNFVFLTVTGLWAQLEIGNKTNQFTCTPAIGTNSITYGDYPWRIYEQNLVERYKVLNTLSNLPAMTYFGTASTNFGDNLAGSASFYGNMSISHSAPPAQGLYYPMTGSITGGVFLGAGGTYDIIMGDRNIIGHGGAWYITVGKSVSDPYGMTDIGRSGEIYLDAYGVTGKTSTNYFNASLTFNASGNPVTIAGARYAGGYGNTPYSVSKTPSSVSVSAALKEYSNPDGGVAAFEFYPIVKIPFQYCK